MKKMLLACMIGASFTLLSTAQGFSAPDMSHSKYCESGSNGLDPICMSPNAMKMHKEMTGMTQPQQKEYRTKFCESGSNGGDPICRPDMANMEETIAGMTGDKIMANRTKYCEGGGSADDPICDPTVMKSTMSY